MTLIWKRLRGIVFGRPLEHGTFRLRNASFKANGLQPEFADASWDTIRDAIYKDRGE